MPSRRNKKGWFFSVLKNHPVNSALPGAKRNIPYAALGIRAILPGNRQNVQTPEVKDPKNCCGFA
jgi:hypothetical protein